MDPQPPPEPERFNGTIRPLREQDLPQVREVLMRGVIDSETEEPIIDEIEQILEDMRKSFDSDARDFLVAERPDKILGVVGMQLPGDKMRDFAKTKRPIELINLFVLPDTRRAGAGSSLVAVLESKAQEKGFTEVVLNSGPRYRKAWKFYDELPGYRRAGILTDHYGPGNDAPVWNKVL
ncbi:hypothetical protein A3G67_01485 [Candidatus Roizmanbacteria bacterium RIFCSPLOWO2_12_FULL_40_12]|nr:MAG: hypothetical protein A3G67_01485 [Candidatus Roizmanbacteria bacterium RIFCSPLOWO2_12_FULL_40_12]